MTLAFFIHLLSCFTVQDDFTKKGPAKRPKQDDKASKPQDANSKDTKDTKDIAKDTKQMAEYAPKDAKGTNMMNGGMPNDGDKGVGDADIPPSKVC